MAVHHLHAPDLIVDKWQPLETFPRDGSIVEVEVDTNVVSKLITRAQWHDGKLLVEGGPNVVVQKVHRWRPND